MENFPGVKVVNLAGKLAKYHYDPPTEVLIAAPNLEVCAKCRNVHYYFTSVLFRDLYWSN